MSNNTELATEKEVREVISIIDDYVKTTGYNDNIVQHTYHLCIDTGDEISPFSCYLTTMDIYRTLASPKVQKLLMAEDILGDSRIDDALNLLHRLADFFQTIERDDLKAQLERAQLDDWYNSQGKEHIEWMKKEYEGLAMLAKHQKR